MEWGAGKEGLVAMMVLGPAAERGEDTEEGRAGPQVGVNWQAKEEAGVDWEELADEEVGGVTRGGLDLGGLAGLGSKEGWAAGGAEGDWVAAGTVQRCAAHRARCLGTS